MYVNWKKTAIVALDLVLAAYITLAMTSFNKPDPASRACKKVSITVADADSSGFLSAEEIKHILTSKHLYPDGKDIDLADLRKIESTLEEHMLVKDAECHKTQDGLIGITVSQKLPMLRVKADNGEDYYIDDEGHIMSNGSYASYLLVATGNISNWYAQNYIQVVARWISTMNCGATRLSRSMSFPTRVWKSCPASEDISCVWDSCPSVPTRCAASATSTSFWKPNSPVSTSSTVTA